MVPVDSPYTLEPTSKEKTKELLWTPAQTILPPGKTNYITFYYKGPLDEKERYYAIQWVDSVVAANTTEETKSATVLAKATVSTVLVVHPKNENITYKYDIKTNSLTNTGNRSIKTVAYGVCKKQPKGEKNKKCQETLYLMPGKTSTYSVIDMNNQYSALGYWKGDNYVPVTIHP